jgi:hypothetical protein
MQNEAVNSVDHWKPALKTTERVFIRNQIGRSLFYSPAGIPCVFEYLSKRDLMLFALAFVVAGCLMAWTIDLSIDRLLYADWEQTASALKLHAQFPQPDHANCGESRITMPQMASVETTPCATAELEPALHIGLR